MVDAISTSLSALKASSEKVRVGANNIANAGTIGTPGVTSGRNAAYTPQDVVNVADPIGGVHTRVVDRDPATSLAYDPNAPQADANGYIAVPNVDLASEIVGLKQADIAYRASLDVIKVAGKMQDELLKTFDEEV